jgi:hypothetical protein
MKYEFDEAKNLIVEALGLTHDEAREERSIILSENRPFWFRSPMKG